MTDGTPRASLVEMNELVLPSATNAIGTVFGGQIMAWIDVCAALSAMRHAGQQCVTASMDALDFIAPIQVGHVVRMQAQVNYVGRTSLEVGVRVEAGDPIETTRVHAASAFLTFVAVDASGSPVPIRPLVLETEEDKRRHAEALVRREQRLSRALGRRELRAAGEGA